MKSYEGTKGRYVLIEENELRIIEPMLTKAVQEFDFKRGIPVWFHPLQKLQEDVQEALSYF